MYCSKCGKELEKNKNFCTECGTKVNKIVREDNTLLFKIIFIVLVCITCVVSQEKMVRIYYHYAMRNYNMKELLEFVDGYLIAYYLLIVGIVGYFISIVCMFIKKELETKLIMRISFSCNMIFIGYILKKLNEFLRYERDGETIVDITTEYFWFFIVANVIIVIYFEWCFRNKKLSN